MIKARVIFGVLAAAVLGFGSAAQAQGWGHDAWRSGAAPQQHQGQRQASPQWQGRQQHQGQQWQGRSQWQPSAYAQRSYASQYPGRAWDSDRYAGGYAGRGGGSHRYRTYDWRARHLSPPPYGYEWVEDDGGEVLLMALATGLIANAIVNNQYAYPDQYAYPAPYVYPNQYPYPY